MDLVFYVCFVDQALVFDYLVVVESNFFDLLDDFLNGNDLLFYGRDRDYFLFIEEDLDYFVHKSINDLVVGDDDWLFGCDLNESWYLHSLFNHFLYLVDLREFVDHLHDLLLNGCDFLDFFLNLNSKDWFFFNDLNLMDLLCDIWHDLLNFLDFLLNHRLLLDLDDLFYRGNLLDNFYYLFH